MPTLWPGTYGGKSNCEFTSKLVSVVGCKHVMGACVYECPLGFSGNFHPTSFLLSRMGKMDVWAPDSV